MKDGNMVGLVTDVTILRPCSEMMETQYGKIFYEAWCRKEIKRIGNKLYEIRYKINKKTKANYCCIAI